MYVTVIKMIREKGKEKKRKEKNIKKCDRIDKKKWLIDSLKFIKLKFIKFIFCHLYSSQHGTNPLLSV